MSINVDTGQVAAAAARIRPLARQAESCASGVTAVQHGLDLRIAASARIDERLRVLSGSVARQSAAMGAQATFLTWASSRYEMAESMVCGRRPPTQTGYTAVAGSTASASGAPLRPEYGYLDDGGVRPASLNDLIRLLTRDLLGADEDVQEGWVDFVGAVPFVGTYLTWDEIITKVQNRDPGAAGMDLFVMIATEGAEKGFGIPGVATLVGLVQSYAHIVLSDQFQQGVVDLLPDPAISFLASDANHAFVNAVTSVGGGISDVAQGAAKAAGGVWDWVNPW